jgi:threonine/homoserine/homoserine lactone efflux protein
LENIRAFTAVAFVLIVVPGPSVMFVVGRALALGRRAALASVLGNTAGVYLQAILVALGLGTVLSNSVTALQAMKLLGSGYLIYLGFQAIRHRGSLGELAQGGLPGIGAPVCFRQGFMVGATNPKGLVLFSAVLPQFVEHNTGSVPVQMLVFGTVAVSIALVTDSVWATVAGGARSWLARSTLRARLVGAGGGGMMIALGLQLASSGRHDR